MLTTLILLPLLSALALTFVPRHYRFLPRLLTLGVTLLTAVLGGLLFLRFRAGEAGYQFVERLTWVPSLGIGYHLGVDGVNLGLVLLAAVVAFAAACVSWEIQTREKEFYILLLVMTGGILGAFASLDLFCFYFFHELALVPTFIMIGVWGRGEDRDYAAFKMTLYLSAGALLALAGLVALYLQMPAGARTFNIVALTSHFQAQPMSAAAQHVLFPLLLFGFGILVSLWPFHTWAPLGYAAAPTATAMLHAGVLKKFGLYGLIRIALPLLPDGARPWLQVLALLCLGNILHCGWVAMRQRDFNRLLGNSSVAHMGFAFLGLASLSLLGVTGAVVVMVAHGFLAALSFGLSGYLHRHTGTLDLEVFGGLLRRLPFIGTALIMAALAGCGLPGFANFPGELLVLFGAWQGLRNFVVVAAWGALVVAAVYMLRAVRHIVHGPMPERWEQVPDASPWRRVPFVMLLAGLFLFGCWPRLLTDRIRPSVEPIVRLATSPSAPVATPRPWPRSSERGPLSVPGGVLAWERMSAALSPARPRETGPTGAAQPAAAVLK